MTTESTTVLDLNQMIRRLLIACVIIQLTLLLADYVINYLDIFEERGMRRIFNIAREQSIPSWFSSIQAQLLGVTVLTIAMVQRGQIPRWRTIAWFAAGLFFLWVGIDDYAELHEKLGGAVNRMAEAGDNTQLTETLLANPSFNWHSFIAPIYALFCLGVLALAGPEFWRRGLWPWMLFGFGCWAVSQAIDFVEGMDVAEDIYDWAQATFGIERRYGVTHTAKLIEEMLEMFGTTLLWIGFLHYLAALLQQRSLRFVYYPTGRS